MKKTFSTVVTIRAVYEVEAETYTEAENKTNEYIREYDFGDLRDIDWDIDAVLDTETETWKA